MKKLKNQQLFGDPSEKLGHRANQCSKYWREKQVDTEDHITGTKTHEQKLPWESVPIKENLNYN